MFPAVFKTVQMDPDAQLVQRSDPEIGIDHSAIIRREGYVQSDNMEIKIHCRLRLWLA
jgi:hypothetical protein